MENIYSRGSSLMARSTRPGNTRAANTPSGRIRLRLDADAPELHALPWETLRDPASDLDLAAADATPFPRFLVWHGFV